MADYITKDAKLVKKTKGVLIYGPYPKGHPDGAFCVSFQNEPERKLKWARDFDDLITILRAALDIPQTGRE